MLETRGVPMKSSEKATRRQFAPEFKSEAVKRVLSGNKVAAVARSGYYA